MIAVAERADEFRRTGPPSAGRRDRLPLRSRRTLRILATTALCALSASGVTRAFHRPAVALVVVLAVPPLLIVLSRLGGFSRVVLHVGSAAVGVSIAVAVAGGQVPGHVVDGLWRGWSFAVSTDWPSPVRPEIIAFAGFNVSLAAALGGELARSRRWRSLCVLPALLLGVLFIALAAEAGPPPAPFLAGWVILAAIVFALADGGTPHAAVREELRGGGRAAATVLALAILGAVVVSTAAPTDRSDPRSDPINPLVQSDELNPLAQVAAERMADPAEPRFSVEGTLAARWRTRVVDTYDGVSWGSDLAVRPVSPAQITEPGRAATIDQQLTITGPALRWVPLGGTPVSIDHPVGSDADRSVLALDEPLPTGATVRISYVPSPARSEVAVVATSRRQLDEQAAPLATLAASLAGEEAGLAERLDQLEAALRDGYLLEPNASASSNIGLLEYALEDARQGSAEQFVAGFVLMARTLGASARIAIGYQAPAAGAQVTSAEALAWPEVWFDEFGWVPYDPIPTRLASGAPSTRQTTTGTRAQDPPQAAPQPPPLSNDQPAATDAELPADRPLVITIAILVGGLLLATLVILVTGAVTVLAVKRRRRTQRLQRGEPFEQVLGAWAEATDRLVDLGARVEPHQTNGEIVGVGAQLLDQLALEPLRTLAHLANEAAHGARPADRIVASHAVRLLGRVEQLTTDGRGRMHRWRVGCSTRSLRRSTRPSAG